MMCTLHTFRSCHSLACATRKVPTVQTMPAVRCMAPDICQQALSIWKSCAVRSLTLARLLVFERFNWCAQLLASELSKRLHPSRLKHSTHLSLLKASISLLKRLRLRTIRWCSRQWQVAQSILPTCRFIFVFQLVLRAPRLTQPMSQQTQK